MSVPSNTSADASSSSLRQTATTVVFQLIGLVYAYFGLQFILFAVDHPITSPTFVYHASLGILVLYGALRTAGIRF